MKNIYVLMSGCKELCSSTSPTGQNGRCPQAELKPYNVTCNAGSNTCQEGACIGSICALYGTNECECHQTREEMCHVCCNSSYVRNNVVINTDPVLRLLLQMLQATLILHFSV